MDAKTVRELGALIRSARLAREETQSHLARRINVAQSTISKIEKGFPGTSIEAVFQVLKGLNLAVSVSRQTRDSHQDLRREDREDEDIDLAAIADTGLRRK